MYPVPDHDTLSPGLRAGDFLPGGKERRMTKLFSEVPTLRGGRIVLRRLTEEDAPGLRAMVSNDRIYRYEPSFLYEKKYPDIDRVIATLYTECFRESIILGIFEQDRFCGLAEIYGYREEIRKASVGYRLLEECWGRGLATEALGLMVRYLTEEAGIEIITASTMAENKASANVLRKNGFTLAASGVREDWGREQPIPTDKWIR